MTKTKVRSRGGRPPLPAADVRNTSVNVAFSRVERARLLERALASGMRPAQFLREAGLSRRLPAPPAPAVNRERYISLARLTALLNQLTKLANSGRNVIVDDDLLKKMIAEVNHLRLDLLGIKE